MSGLEYLRAIMRGEQPAALQAELMGFGPVEAEEGRAVFRRYYCFRPTHGSLRPPEAARSLLLLARPLAAAPAVRHLLRGALYLRSLLRSRLHRHSPPDGRPRRR